MGNFQLNINTGDSPYHRDHCDTVIRALEDIVKQLKEDCDKDGPVNGTGYYRTVLDPLGTVDIGRWRLVTPLTRQPT